MFAMLVDLAKTPEAVKEETAPPTAGAVAYDDGGKRATPAYPYGLTICLNEDSLDKLGLGGDLPDVGDQVTIIAVGTVTSASANESKKADGGTVVHKRVEIELREMGVQGDELAQAEEALAKRTKRWYGEAKGDGAAAAETPSKVPA